VGPVGEGEQATVELVDFSLGPDHDPRKETVTLLLEADGGVFPKESLAVDEEDFERELNDQAVHRAPHSVVWRVAAAAFPFTMPFG